MATQNAADALEDHLTCCICLETLSDPKVLWCLHVNCKKCLEKLVKKDKATIKCPQCGKLTTIPADGVAGLHCAFFVNNLFEIKNSLSLKRGDSLGERETRFNSVSSVSSTATTISEATPSEDSLKKESSLSKKSLLCPDHTRELDLYCKECHMVICSGCTTDGNSHNGHKFDFVTKVIDSHREKISGLLGSVEEKVQVVDWALSDVDTRCTAVSDLRQSIEGSIHEATDKLCKMVDIRRTALIDQLHRVTEKKLKYLAADRDGCEFVHERLASSAQMLRDCLDLQSEAEILQKEGAVTENVKKMTSGFEPGGLQSSIEANMVFSLSPEFTQMWRNFGEIFTPEEVDPLQCTARGEGLEIAFVKETSVVYLRTCNYKGEPCIDSTPSCELVFQKTGAVETCLVISKGQNLHQISFQPQSRGRYSLHIKITDRHIKGSPFSLAAKIPVDRIRRPILVIERVVEPWGVAITKDDNLVVSECRESKISIFNLSGKLVRSFGVFGTETKQFKYPRGVALDSEDNIFVVDSYNHRVQKFTQTGQFLASAGHQGTDPTAFVDPKGIAFNSANNKLYVADVHTIKILTTDLDFVGMFGRPGKGQLTNAFSVACDSVGNVYVSDKSNSIQIFTSQGEFLRVFQSGKNLWGGGKTTTVNTPVALAIDDCDHVYVSEDGHHHVSVFTHSGTCKASFGKEGPALGEFKHPRGLAVNNSTGVIFVCDFENYRVQAF